MQTRRFVLAAAIGVFAQLHPAATIAMPPDAVAEIIATQLRRQGHACTAPRDAVRDSEHSRPLQTVWIVHCDEASYRITLIPNRGALITTLRREEKRKTLQGSDTNRLKS